MINAIPKWVWKRYALLWKKFKDQPFTYSQTEKILKYDDKTTISVTFMEMRKAGWLKMELDQKDTRKRIYQLSNPIQVVEAVNYDIKKRNS